MAELQGEGETAPRMYEDLGDFGSIKPLFEEVQALYNRKRKPFNLVFFEDALEHLTRIHRTMRLPQVRAGAGAGGAGAGAAREPVRPACCHMAPPVLTVPGRAPLPACLPATVLHVV